MLHANADQRVLGYLGRALSLEFSAVQLYSTQARLLGAWGLAEVADHLSKEAMQELEHAQRIIARMLALGVAPNASQLRPVKLGQSLYDMLVYDHHFESELVALYDQATRHCARNGDHDNRLFFETLLKEEQEHAQHLAKWLQEIQQTGAAEAAKR